jgi:hypothetical protein
VSPASEAVFTSYASIACASVRFFRETAFI